MWKSALFCYICDHLKMLWWFLLHSNKENRPYCFLRSTNMNCFWWSVHNEFNFNWYGWNIKSMDVKSFLSNMIPISFSDVIQSYREGNQNFICGPCNITLRNNCQWNLETKKNVRSHQRFLHKLTFSVCKSTQILSPNI